MATIANGFTTWLLTKTAVTTLLSTTADSIFTDKAGLSSKRPFIYIQLISNSIDYQTSASKGMITLASARLKISCEAKTREAARNIAEQVRLLFLSGFQGTMGTMEVRAGFLVDLSDRRSQIISGKEQGLPAIECDINLEYEMATS